MRCLICNRVNHPSTGALNCEGCGASLPVVCRSCHYVNATNARFCSGCGRRLHALPGAHNPEHGPAERRQISVVFCDLVNSSLIAAQSDPEDFRDTLLAYQRRCAEVVARFEGHIAQYLGDGLLVYFGYPAAQEDAVVRALRAGCAMVTAVGSLATQGTGVPDVALELRVGIHTGPVVVGAMGGEQRIEFLAVGETPNMAARIQAAASPGMVVVSETTFRLARGYFDFEDLGVSQLKGIPAPQRLFRVLGETSARTRLEAASRQMTRFVGRERELEQLQQWWAEATQGNAPCVLLSGEPGIGKSRHVRTFSDSLDNACLRIQGHCSPLLRARALHPIATMLHQRLDLGACSTPADQLERIAAELRYVELATKPALSLLGQLLDIAGSDDDRLGLSPARQRQLTFEALGDWISGLTARQSVLLVIEDLHWADPSTLEFLEALLARNCPGPLMIVLTYRPEFRAPWVSPRVRELGLSRLTSAAAMDLMRGVPGADSLPLGAASQILQKAEGVPLFIEEITRAVVESSSALPLSDAPVLQIPATLQDSLAARLDRLPSGKALLQLASAIGRNVPLELLCAVLDSSEDVVRAEVETLVLAGLLLRRDDTPREQYAFKHALIQDAAYASLIKSVRQDLHSRIAHTLTRRAGEVEPEILAEHFAAGGEPLAASEHYARAGQRSIASSAFSEAIAIFERALGLLLSLPSSVERDRREIELLAGLGLAQLSTRGFSAREVEETYARARALCERYGDLPMRILFGVWAVHIVRGDVEATSRLVPVFESKIAAADDESNSLIGHAALATRAFHLGNYEEAAQQCHAGMRYCNLAAPRQQFEHLVRQHGYEGLLYPHLIGAWAQLHLGQIARAARLLQEALAVADQTELPYLRAMAYAYAAAYAMDAGDTRQAQAAAVVAVRLSSEHSYPFWLGCALCIDGWADVWHEQLELGIPKLERGLATLNAIGASIMIPYYTGCMANAQLRAGQIAEALATARHANEMPGSKTWRFCSPELARLEGEALLLSGQLDEAEDRLRAAWQDAQSTRSKLWVLSTATSLAQALSARSKRDEARLLLGQAYEELPEKTDLPVLVRAAQVLATLH